MATHPSVPALAGTRDDCAGRLLLIGIQPQEFEDFRGGLRPGVKRRIGMDIGIVSGLVPLDTTPFSAWREG